MVSVGKLGVAFIGTGFIARFMAQSWTSVRGSDIKAVFSPSPEGGRRLSAYIESLGMERPKVYTEIGDMISNKDINAVWIMSPNFAHLNAVKVIVEEAKQGKGNLVGVCCEKPLGRTADEAEEMLKLIESTELLHGYLENQVFQPGVVRGRDVLWGYGARRAGRPYLARASEEHGGPHASWFWDPIRSGGGVLLDMACHSIEAARFLLTDPNRMKDSFKPSTVTGKIASLKWSKEPARSQLMQTFGVDYSKTPAEDYAAVDVVYKENGDEILSECRTSWCYSGPGLRLSFEVLGPEYSIQLNSLQQELSIFLSRNIGSGRSEDFVEKQAAEQGLMPIVSDEAVSYGYVAECKHMVDSFLKGVQPREDWHDGLLVTRIMMHAYKSAEEGRALKFIPEAVRGFKPKVANGQWGNKD